MAYIGKAPVNGFHSKQTLTTDGSTVTFTLDFAVADETSIIVSVGGVLQEPKVAYNLAGGGTQITFTAAPASTDTAYIQFLGQAIVQNLLDINGAALILDADADTTITADTDDQIDIAIAGADDFQFTANKFSTLSGSNQEFADNSVANFGASNDMTIFHDGTDSLITNKTGAMKIATETSGIAVTIGHTTSETTVADNLTVTGNLTVGGSTSFGDFDITNVGSIALDSITNDGTDITLDSSNDIVIDAEGGNIEFKDAGTLQLTLDMDGTAGAQVIKLGVDSDDLIFQQYDGNEVIRIADDRRLYFFDKGGEYIVGDGTDLSIFASADINIPANVGLTFGDDGEKIEGDGTDLTISGNNINLTATADVNIPSGVGITFATAEKIESDGTDLSITVGSGGDINIPANIGVTFGDDGEKIEGDGTDLTITGNNINLTATADVVVPANVGVTFGSGEKIEGDNTDLTVTSGAKINLTATTDVHIPNNVGIVFGGDSEKIEGDGTDMTISANNLTIDAAADISFDAAGNDFKFLAGGTEVLNITNSSSDVVIKPIVDAKDLIFQQRDGTEVMRIEDGAHASFAAAAVNPEATLTDASTISWNVLTSPVAKVTLGANRTLGAGSGAITGQFVSLLVIQDGTGSRTLSFNAVYEFKDDTAPTLTTTASKGDLFVFRYNGSKFLEVGRNQNLTLS
jgi:hypothetical protein